MTSLSFSLRTSHIKVLVSICSDIAAGLILLSFTASTIQMLTADVVVAILCTWFAVHLTEFLERYEF